MSEPLVLLAVAIVAGSGIPGYCLGRPSMLGQHLSLFLVVVASGLGLAGVAIFWDEGKTQPIEWPWPLVPGASFGVAVDGLSAFFLTPIFLISLLCNVYGLGYWKHTEHRETGRKLRLFCGTLTAGMALLVIARNSVVFLFGWEVMALSAFFLVTTESHDGEVRASGWLYLAAAHTATLCLFGAFALLRAATGSFALSPPEAVRPGPATMTAVFVLAVLGFGIKAGVMPLHVWLPSAHAAAPSHVSAIMSGVLIKMGIYGMMRVMSLYPTPPLEWGSIVLALGAVSGVLGVALAVGQHDIKRLLAYHSIENIGIIVMGLGLALIGRSMNRGEWIVLGLAGALLHVWNHALFKSLLFLGAGSVIHAAQTRDIDRLGGLARVMPVTAACFLVGAVAICGLPPLNGFVSEFLIYLGLFGTLGDARSSYAAAAFAAPALALIGALAVACFVKVCGAVFLGAARSDAATHAHESPGVMLAPMGVLVLACFAIGLAPMLLVPILGQAVTAWDPRLADAAFKLTLHAPLHRVTIAGVLLLALVVLASFALRGRLKAGTVAAAATWGCGYAAPTARMQYTSSSFAQILVGLFAWALRPRVHRPRRLALFPAKSGFHSETPDPVLDDAVLPAFRIGTLLVVWLRIFQRGSIQAYLVYVFIALIVMLVAGR